MSQNTAPGEQPRRRRHFSMGRLFRRIFLWVVLLAVAFVLVRFGPNLYRRFFGDGNITWVSQRFSEELKEKNELVVYEATITGQETVSQDAWLLGTVQQVVVPYSFSISFTVDLSQSQISANALHDTIQIHLPAPKADFAKLTVDENAVVRHDLFYPLTPERYASIKNEIEQKLYAECSAKPEYLSAAWDSAVKQMDGLFKGITARSEDGVTCQIQVIQDIASEPEATETASGEAQP